MPDPRSDDAPAVDLACAGRVVARYVWAPDLPRYVSPRPYLHPVTTLGGTVVTGFMPADHRHHLGASVAVPALNDVNFWGGRTYVRDRGAIDLDNHGSQRHAHWLHRSADRLVHEVDWIDPSGAPVAREQRTLEAHPVGGMWMLRVTFALRGCDATTPTLTIDSPGARGRTGAGYGGFFWRAPPGSARVRAFGAGEAPGDAPGTAGAGDADRAGPGGAGVGGAGAPSAPGRRAGSGDRGSAVTHVSAPPMVDGTAHGSRRDWVALTGRHDGEPWTLVFLADPARVPDPWFVRAADYAGVCAAVAWDRPLVVAAGSTLVRRVGVLVADGALTATGVEAAVAASRDLPG